MCNELTKVCWSMELIFSCLKQSLHDPELARTEFLLAAFLSLSSFSVICGHTWWNFVHVFSLLSLFTSMDQQQVDKNMYSRQNTMLASNQYCRQPKRWTVVSKFSSIKPYPVFTKILANFPSQCLRRKFRYVFIFFS